MGTPHGLKPIDRFLVLVEIAANGCWNWTGLHDRDGYARFYYGFIEGRPRTGRAGRWAYRWFRGDFERTLQIDHLCRNRGCVNPDHLEPVTCAENIRRGNSGLVSGAIQRAKTHCPRGHPYSGKNLYVNPSSGGRMCKKCLYNGNRRRLIERKAVVNHGY